MPTKALYYASRIIGTKNYKQSMNQLSDAIVQANDVSRLFAFYTCREWVFDSRSQNKLNAWLSPADRAVFEVDATTLNWRNYAMNCGYGIKKYILNEEASLPAVGYNDVV